MLDTMRQGRYLKYMQSTDWLNPTPCDHYEPDSNEQAREGQMCAGFGWRPHCITCGFKQIFHERYNDELS